MDSTSTGVKLKDLNDFINPSTQCIKPLITEETTQMLVKNTDVINIITK